MIEQYNKFKGRSAKHAYATACQQVLGRLSGNTEPMFYDVKAVVEKAKQQGHIKGRAEQ